MTSYCITNKHTKKVDTLNNMLNLENVCVQNMFLLVVKNPTYLMSPVLFKSCTYTLLKNSLALRYCLSVAVLLADLRTREQPASVLFCCGEGGRFWVFLKVISV